MRPAILLRLAVAGGRSDSLRIGLTAASSALASVTLLAAATVAAVPEPADHTSLANGRYSTVLLDEPGMRPGLVTALLMLSIPVLVLAGQCVRFGSPARDRRLAALRLAGATPGQAVLVATAETAAGALLGSLIGFGIMLFGRVLLGRPNLDGMLPLPTDVLPAAPVVVGILLSVPVVAGLFGAFLMRGVIVTPLGVVRRTRTRTPRLWPGVLLILGGLAPFASPLVGRSLSWLLDGLPAAVSVVVVWGVVLLAVLGVVVGTGWICFTSGRVLQRFGRRPAMLLAGRQLIAAPWAGSRTLAALLSGVVLGTGALLVRQTFTTGYEANQQARSLVPEVIWYPGNDQTYILQILDMVTAAVVAAVLVCVAGVMVALAEGVVTRRRSYAALVAGGVPRRTLGEALAWQTMTPLVPAVLVAISVGFHLTKTVGSMDTEVTGGGGDELGCHTGLQGCDATTALESQVWMNISTPLVRLDVPVPVEGLVLLGGGTFAVMLLAVGVAVLVLRMSTNVEELRVA